MAMRAASSMSRFAAVLALAALVACSGDKPRYLADVMAPPGSTPDQVRAFCTQLGDEAANWNDVAPLGPSRRARDDAFARCMARHHIAP
jgi:hypothetical protein